jgi:hypothetical protein
VIRPNPSLYSLYRSYYVDKYTIPFIVAEFLLLSFVYRKQIFKSRLLFYILLTMLSSLFKIDTLSRSVAVYIAYAITGFYLMLKRQKVVHLEKSAFFWTNTAFLVYSSGSFLIFLLRDFMMQEEQTSKDYAALWKTCFVALNICKNLLLSPAIYYINKTEE